jgi:hypothetical protein
VGSVSQPRWPMPGLAYDSPPRPVPDGPLHLNLGRRCLLATKLCATLRHPGRRVARCAGQFTKLPNIAIACIFSTPGLLTSGSRVPPAWTSRRLDGVNDMLQYLSGDVRYTLTTAPLLGATLERNRISFVLLRLSMLTTHFACRRQFRTSPY